MNILERCPEAGQEVRLGIRNILIRRFPYKLIYIYRDDMVYILAVAYSYREPDYWKDPN